jgi:GNAT superfamily N-acetyltransferase
MAGPRSLICATDIDVLPASRIVERRDDHLVVRSPTNPTHWWGNYLLFDDPPRPGDRDRWEALFVAEFPDAEHRAFGWDRTDGEAGAAEAEFVPHGYRSERLAGLIAAPAELRSHPRANRLVHVVALDPAPGADARMWSAVQELQVASRDPTLEDEPAYRAYNERWLADQRELMTAGRGAWYVALTAVGEVAGSCGVIVTGSRGRYRAVDTAEPWRRQGVSSRLVVQAGRLTAARFGAERLVIAADVDYHALGLYEYLGFVRREQTVSVVLAPSAAE